MAGQDDGAGHGNRLGGETSPYLLQHARNPVAWQPWDAQALAAAKSANKPILLSIGYAACHWCHVMERESFEDEATALLMNEHFVCIKVDREERPDLDEIYMAATVAMSGSGGWPMTVFLTPDKRPFFAGTYFPPEDRYGRPGFKTLLTRVAKLWAEERGMLEAQADDLTRQIDDETRAAMPVNVAAEALDEAERQLFRSFDSTWGGFGRAPKFPPAQTLRMLLRQHRRTGEARPLTMVRATLDGMMNGGMRDHLGGGFHRYSTDDEWLVPHFEKMLYDNALLAVVYAEASQAARAPEYEAVARDTLDYLLREMTSPEGAFYSATDADSEGVEGKFFVWTPDEVESILPPEQARAFAAYYDVTPEGNWEGHSILRTLRSKAEVAGQLGIDEAELERRLAAARDKMYRARKERAAPLCDDKILTAWNALAIAAFAEGGRVLAESRYATAAARAADYLLATMRRPDGGLYRTSRAGKTHLAAYLEDYAYLADALIDVYEAGAGERFLVAARDLAERLLADFHDPKSGGFFHTARDHEALITRSREGQDNAIPSANAVAARALARLSWHFGVERFRDIAAGAVRAHGRLIERAPRAFSSSLMVADMLLEGAVEVVLTGAPDDARTAALRREVGRVFLPNRVLVHLSPGAPVHAPDGLVAGKDAAAPTLYVCRNFACKAPVTEPAEVARSLEGDRIAAVPKRQTRLSARRPGRATAEGTSRYAGRFPRARGFVELRGSELTASRIGFGGYRVDDANPLFADALRKALRSGANLIDTSTNYGSGGSERLVGAVLGELIAAHELARDEVIVVSKIGYVQGPNLELAERRKSEGAPFKEMVEYAEDCWHCIHPEWLADQLERSLDRLGLDTLDVCLLHNPEYFLTDAAQDGDEIDDATRDRFYERVTRAFAFFEEQVKAGRIGAYGVSSNTVAKRRDAQRDATELARFLQAANAAGGQRHHFQVLQLPLNLLESDAAIARIGKSTVLERAALGGLSVLANRPLNAFAAGPDGERMVRLAEPPPARGEARPIPEALAAVRALEQRFATEVAKNLATEPPSPPVSELFRWGRDLAGLDERIDSAEQFDQFARARILPGVAHVMTQIERALLPEGTRTAWSEWRVAYLRELEGALAAMRHAIAARAAREVARIRAALDPLLPAERRGEPLSRKALWALTSTPGLSVTLLGMRRPAYVDDALGALDWPPLEDPMGIYRALAGLG